MKLVRYGAAGQEKPGMLDRQGHIRDLSAVVADIDGSTVSPEGLSRLRAIDPETLPRVDGNPRLGPPVNHISKLVCIGLNYSDHAKESGMAIPTEPVMFMKATTSVTGPNDQVRLPRGSKKGDWEVELGFVMGRKAQSVSEAEALDYVAGYVLVNDVSEREWQLEHGSQWVKGKSFDTFAPIGPWFVTADEIADPHNLSMWLDVNGQRCQTGNTNTMIFRVPKLVSYLSYVMTLLPGDVVSTGTPPGVGLGMKPPMFLKAGDVMRLGIDGLGEQRQEVTGG